MLWQSMRSGVLVTVALGTCLACGTAFAANDPNAPPPDPNGGVVVPAQQPVTMQANVQVQQPGPSQPAPQPPPNEPPARDTPMFAIAPTFHLPLLGTYADRGAFGGGTNVHVGYAHGNWSFLFSPALLYYTNGTNSEAALTLGAVIRYTILRDVVIHPFAEIGLDYVIPFIRSSVPLNHREGALGVSLAIGAEWDLSDHLSLQLAARGAAMVGRDGVVYSYELLFTPFLSLVYYR